MENGKLKNCIETKKLELVSRWRCYSHHMLLLKSLAWFSFLIILLNCDCTWSCTWSCSWSWTQSKVWKINSNQHGRETFVVNIFFKTEKNDFFFQNASFFFFELVKKKKMKNQLFVERKLRGGERKAFYLKAVSQRDYTFIPLLFSSSPHNKTMTTKWLNRSNRKSK